MTMQFAARFTRYDSKSGERRNSDVRFINAENFDGAVSTANAILSGMKAADASRDYALMSVEATGYVRAVDCRGIGDLFETDGEFSERVAKTKAA